ncbi:translocation/assembly module TamB [Ectothiorhodospiraceae bacterium WFHF3C12]|nr:translocation/assembly module TamB [Ectothiorhodospiraceae bacterium WFHF3C12]
MKRRVLAGFLLVLLLLTAAAAVVVTSQAVARYLVNQGAAAVPGLRVTFRDGTLWSGIGVTELRYRGGGIELSAGAAELRWSLHCLANGNLCMDRVAASDVLVRVTQGSGTGGNAEAAAMPVLPLDILFRAVAVDGLTVLTPAAEVELDSARLHGALTNQGLTIASARLSRPHVRLLRSGSQPETAPAQPAEPLALPVFSSPLPVTVERLWLERPAVTLTQGHYEADGMEFQGQLSGQRLSIQRLSLQHPQGRGSLSGRVRFTEGYPIDLRLQATANAIHEGRDQRVSADLSGRVADLGVKAQLEGLIAARVDGRVSPLEPAVPYSATVRAGRIGWPLAADAQQVTGRDLRLRLRGDLSGYRVSASGGLEGSLPPPLDWRLEARGDWQQARIDSLALDGLDGTARVAGEVTWSPEVSWQAEITAEGVQPSKRWPAAPERIGGRARVTGALESGGWRLDVTTPDIDLRYRGQSVALNGTVRHLLDGSWRAEPLRVASGANRAEVRGSLDGGLDLRAALDVPEPGHWLPDLDGDLRGTVAVQGAFAGPDIRANVTATDLTYQGMAVDEARLEADVAALGRGRSRVSLQVGGATYGERHLDNLRLVLSGVRSTHRLTLQASGEGAATELGFEGGLADGWDWQGRLAEGAIAWEERRWLLSEPADMYFDATELQARMEPHCWRRERTELCLAEPARFGRAGEVTVRLSDMPLGWLGEWLPEGLTWHGRLSGDVQADWSAQRPPRLTADLVSRDGRMGVQAGAARAEPDAALPLGYESLSLEARLDAEQLRARVELVSSTLGDANVNATLRHAAPGRPIDGRVEVEGIELAVFEPFFPRIETLRGRLAMAGKVGGTLTAPAFNGEVTLRDGEVQGRELPMHLEAVSLTVDVEGRRFRIDGGLSSGGGQAELTGRGAWHADGWQVNAALTGERLQVQYPPLAVLRVSPDLQLQADQQAIELTGTIRVPEGQLTLRQLPKGAVPYSTDVVIVRGPGAQTGAGENGAAGPRLSTRIDVVLGDEVRFSGLGAEGRLTGALSLRQVGATTAEGTGEIRIVDANFEAYGQRLDIRRGRLIFAGPVTEPLVEIEAVRQVDTVVAGLRVEGPAAQPEVTLFSEPPMPEEQILAYLVIGRAYGEAGPEGDAAMAQAAVALGVFTSRGAASDIASELGVEDFQLAAEGEGETTQVTVSGYIAPNLLVKYGVGVFAPHNTLTLRYNVTRNVYLEAVSGLESAIDAFYTFSF